MRKGEQTRAAILDAAIGLSSRHGLEGMTIGALAETMRMSKSGVFAHFGSREELQIAVLKAYESRFVDDVLRPALTARRGLARLTAIVERWLDRTAQEAERGCIWIAGATEYDDRPGPVRDALVAMVRSWQRELARALEQAVETGDLRPDTDVPAAVFDLHGVILVLHHDARLLRSPDARVRAGDAVARVLAAYRNAPPAERDARAPRARPARRPRPPSRAAA